MLYPPANPPAMDDGIISHSSWVPMTPFKSNHHDSSSINLLDQGFTEQTTTVFVPGILLHNSTATILTPQFATEQFSVPNSDFNFSSSSMCRQSGSSFQYNLNIVQDLTRPPATPCPCPVGIISVTDQMAAAKQTTNKCTIPVVNGATTTGDAVEKKQRRPKKQNSNSKPKKPKTKVHRPKILNFDEILTKKKKSVDPKTPNLLPVTRKRSTPPTKIRSNKRKSIKKKGVSESSFSLSSTQDSTQQQKATADNQVKRKSSKRVLKFDLNSTPPEKNDAVSSEFPEPLSVCPDFHDCDDNTVKKSTDNDKKQRQQITATKHQVVDENDCGHRPAKRRGLRSHKCLVCIIQSLLSPNLKQFKRLRTVKYRMSKSIAKAYERLSFVKKWMLLPNKMQTHTLLKNLEPFKCVLAMIEPLCGGKKKRSRRRVTVHSDDENCSLPPPDEVVSMPDQVVSVLNEENKSAECISPEEKPKKPAKKTGPPKLTGRNAVSLEDMMEYLIKTLSSLYITPTALVLYKETKMQVDLDPETEQVYYLLKDKPEGYDPVQEAKEEKKKWWEEERRKLTQKVDYFTSVMHAVLGDRSFSPWKGSILDSVVGVYLTQNVSDHLSSSAFMSMASKFPVRSPSKTLEGCEEPIVMNEQQSSKHIEKLTHPNGVLSSQELHVDETEKRDVHTTVEDIGHMKSPEVVEPSSSQSPDKGDTSKEKQKMKGKKGGGTDDINWDDLRTSYSKLVKSSPETMDSVDWEAVRTADLKKISDCIAKRGQQNIMARSIKDFLNRMVKDHGSTDLEWLRNVPPEKAKEYLLSIRGLGLKSVECIRLLTLHHHAFPVDINVGRIVVRLGWVPLQPLPEEVEIHLLNNYPIMDKIQAYLWPRLCHLDQPTLYRLHYLMITFGKVFCIKKKPNCGPCPLKAQCRHYASAWASSRRALTGPPDKRKGNNKAPKKAVRDPFDFKHALTLPFDNLFSKLAKSRDHEPIIEYPPSPEPELEHIASSEDNYTLPDLEDYFSDDPDAIPVLNLTDQAFKENVQKCLNQWNLALQHGDGVSSSSIVSLQPHRTFMTPPKWKLFVRLRTEHQVYELPDSHPLLYGLDKRENGDPCPYLIAIWTKDICKCEGKEPKTLEKSESFSCHICEATDPNIHVRGTLLIPCRTALRGSFPLNGTYFQINEVFADHESSKNPIEVPRSWLWNLRRRTLYCGSSISSIMRDASIDEVQKCFWEGFICVRAFNRTTRGPEDLDLIFHEGKRSKPKK